MATTPLRFFDASGLTLKADILSDADSSIATDLTVTELTNAKGVYGFNHTGSQTGILYATIYQVTSGDYRTIAFRVLSDNTETVYPLDMGVDAYDLLEADIYIDTTGDPWQHVLIKKGSGNLSTGVALQRRDITGTDDADLSDENDIPGNYVAA